ncbi:MAG: ABC transporter substrate-binding protein [Pseudomonadota bacterium]
MKRLMVIMFIFVGALVSTWPVMAADVPGVDDKTIKVGMLTDFSGPGRHPGNECYMGVKMWVEETNMAGGIHGRKLELFYGDHGWDPSRGMAEARRLVVQHNVFAFVGTAASSVNKVLMPWLEKENLPNVGPMSVSAFLWNPPTKTTFAILTDTNSIFQVLTDYIVNDMKVQKPKLGIIYQDDEWGKDGLRGLEIGAKKHGAPIVAAESYKRGSVDFATQVLNCKKAGAEYIFHPGFSAAMAGIMQEAAKINYSPKFFGETGCMTFSMLKVAGALAKDQIFGYPTAVDGIDVPGMKKLKEISDKYRPSFDSKFKAGDQLDPNYIIGYGAGIVAGEAMKRAGRDITRDKFIEALESLKDWDTGGLFGPITYGPGDRDGSGWTMIYKADPDKMQFIPVTGFKKPAQ